MATTKVSKAVGNARLTKLALFLLTVPNENFNFGEWFATSGDKPDSNCAEASCGTTACALGWGPSIKSFRKAGMRLKYYEDTFPDPSGAKDENGYAKYVVGYRGQVTIPGSNDSLKTARMFFGLTQSEAENLFLPGGSGLGVKATAAQVSQHLLSFVAKRTTFR